MPQPNTSPAQRGKANSELLQKGVLIALIGLAVLIAPAFMAATEMRAIVTSSYLVGWFALLLGGVFIAQHAARRWKDRQARGTDKR